MAQIDELLWVTFVADAETPAEVSVWVGRVVGVPPGTPLSTDGTGTLLGLPGYARQGAGGWEWVLAPAQDPLMRHVNRIPGAGGWNNLDSRQTWRQAARRLRAAGVSGPELQPILTDLYAAAIVNHTTPPA